MDAQVSYGLNMNTREDGAMSDYQDQFDTFMKTDFQHAVDKSTASDLGYSVELFVDSYRLLNNKEIGNLYESEGLILGIPVLYPDEIDQEDESLNFYDNAEESMRDKFQEAMQEMEEYKSSLN